MNANGGAKYATSTAASADPQTIDIRQERRATRARYASAITSNTSFGPSCGNATTPSTAGAAAGAPRVLIASAVPKLAPPAFARALRWLNSAPMTTVGGPNDAIASAASAQSAALMLDPNVSSASALSRSAPHRLAEPRRHAAASAP